MEPDPQPDFLTGQLLIAMPGIGDPRFARTVIYLCSHSAEGALGLVVNRAAEGLQFADLLEQLGIATTPSSRTLAVHQGGPVERGRGFVLHTLDWRGTDTATEAGTRLGLTASLDILRAIARGEGPKHALLALGYSGWGPGQLEHEIRRNGWLTGRAADDIVFGSQDSTKWTAALQGLGIDAALLSASGGSA